MRVVLKNFLRNASTAAVACLMAGTFVGCGDASDPEAVTIDELKAPGGLWIQDNGDGAVTLYWSGANYEDDFDGYNVYGMKDDGSLLGTFKEGQAVKFLDEEGGEVAGAKDFLASFNYDPAGDKLEKAAVVEEDGEKKFSALPIHEVADTFPTCGHDGAGVCKPHNADFPVVTVGDASARGTAGEISYSVSGLKPGSDYCFFVLASISGGTKVSASSTNIVCVNPRFNLESTVDIPGDGEKGIKVDLNAVVTACKAATDGKCPAVTPETEQDTTNASTGTGLIFERFSKGGMTAGRFVGIQDLGYYADGFADASLPMAVPEYVVGTVEASKTALNSTGGYAPFGQTVGLQQNHIYAIAYPATEAVATDATAPTEFYYHMMFVNSTAAAGDSATLVWRLGATLNAR